jgi:hypothetical protein
MLTSMTTKDRNASPIKPATRMNSRVSPWFSLPIMSALLRAAMAARPVTEIV